MEIQLFKQHLVNCRILSFRQSNRTAQTQILFPVFRYWIWSEFCCRLQNWCETMPLIICALLSHNMSWLFKEFWCWVNKQIYTSIAVRTGMTFMLIIRISVIALHSLRWVLRELCTKKIVHKKMAIIQSTQRGFSILSEPKHRALITLYKNTENYKSILRLVPKFN